MLQHSHHVDEFQTAVSLPRHQNSLTPITDAFAPHRILDTHHKTLIVGISFFITTAGWWAWSAFLSYAYSDNLSPFDVKGGFDHTFGPDLNWWLVVLITLTVMTVIELLWKSVRRELAVSGRWPPWKGLVAGKSEGSRTAEELDLGVWQEMQDDAAIRERLRELAGERQEEEIVM